MQGVFAILIIAFGVVLIVSGISGQYVQLLATVGLRLPGSPETEKLVK